MKRFRGQRRRPWTVALALFLTFVVGANAELILSDQESEVYYNFAVVAGEEIQVEKDVEIAGDLHSNGLIDLKKDSSVVGDVSAVGEIDNQGTVDGTVSEGADPLGLPALLDETALRALADRVFEENVTFEDEVIDDVVFVAGTLRIRGDVNGVGTLIATKDIRLDATEGDTFSLDDETRLSLIAFDDIRIGKDRPLRGVLRAGRDIDVEMNTAFEGVMVADRKIHIKQGSRITFLDFDQVAPEIALISPEDGSFVAASTPEIVVEYSDDFSGLRLESVELLLDGVDVTAEAAVGETGLTFTPSAPLADGAHTVEVAITDPSDNEARETFSFTVDTVPPAVAITSPAEALIFNTVPPIEAVYSDATSGVDLASLQVAVDASVLVGCTVAGTSVSCPAPALAEGSHTVSVAVSDVAGNAASASFDFELIFDTEPPVITITSPADGTVLSEATVEVTGTAADDSGVASVTVNGQAANVAGDAFSATIELAPGANTIVVEASDTLGNAGSVSISVTLGGDATPPTLSIDAPPSGVFLADNQPDIDVSFDDDDSGVDTASLAFTVDGAPLAVSCTVESFGAQCTPVAPLPEGSIVLGATLSDVAGNTATTSRQLTIDTVGVEVAITAPDDGEVTRDAEVLVTGTVGVGVASVRVNDVAAAVSSGAFSATVPLREGTNMVVALATKTNGNSGTASIEVTRDIEAPIVKIDTPRDGLVAVSDTIAVTGLVNDIVSGGAAARVFVNGAEALVGGGSFILPDLQLVPGPNVIEAIATDAVGNEGRDAITVSLQPPVGARLLIESGNGQFAAVNSPLPQPLVVVVKDDLGNPVAGRVVRFEVTRNSGVLRPQAPDEPQRIVQVPTDGAGQASVLFALGDTAGEGNNRVRATGLGVAGEVEFCASALTAAADKILMVAGDNQRGLVGNPLTTPLEALVVDADGNPIAGIEVTFDVVQGTGTLDTQSSLVRPTGLDGVARAVLTLGIDPGINSNVVSATFAGLVGLPATFTASGLAAGDPAQTRFAGVVLDNGQTPIPGARASIAGTSLETFTDDQGQFQLDNVPVGRVELDIDPTGSPRPEEFPPLAFETVTVAGQRNTIGQPILIPALDTANSKIVGGAQDVTLIMADVEGLSLTVFANSATFPDGSSTGQLTISQVHLDKVPMPPPSGTIFMPPAWTIQPAGVRFDPPARITIPNDGLPPGRVIDIFQFDHTLNQFINVGKGTVSDDGFLITSDPGFGITRAGWGGCGQPPPPTSDNEGPDCPTEGGQSPIPGGETVPPPDDENPNHGDGRFSEEGDFRNNTDGTPRPHRGVDIAAEEGTAVGAIADGTVTFVCPASTCTQSGNQVVIEHADGTISRYFHLEDGSVTVSEGDPVSAGETIGNSGTTGNAEGTDAPHLHLEIRDGDLTGPPLDPTGCL